MIRTQIRPTEEQPKRVKEIAAHRGVPMAEVIQDAIDGAIRSNAGTVPEVTRKRALDNSRALHEHYGINSIDYGIDSIEELR